MCSIAFSNSASNGPRCLRNAIFRDGSSGADRGNACSARRNSGYLPLVPDHEYLFRQIDCERGKVVDRVVTLFDRASYPCTKAPWIVQTPAYRYRTELAVPYSLNKSTLIPFSVLRKDANDCRLGGYLFSGQHQYDHVFRVHVTRQLLNKVHDFVRTIDRRMLVASDYGRHFSPVGHALNQ